MLLGGIRHAEGVGEAVQVLVPLNQAGGGEGAEGGQHDLHVYEPICQYQLVTISALLEERGS